MNFIPSTKAVLASAAVLMLAESTVLSAPYATFTNNGSFTVPASVTQIQVSMWGGGGNSPGAYVTGNLAVTPGQVLGIAVGGGGAGPQGPIGSQPGGGGRNGGGNGGSRGGFGATAGGGGGGFSGIFTSTSLFDSTTVLALAAGGGGSSPVLTPVTGSGSFQGGQGGSGGYLSGGISGDGGWGAGGGFNGGAPGKNGLLGTLDFNAIDGTSGGPAGCYLALLTSDGMVSAVPSSVTPFVGSADPFYDARYGGGGEDGYVVIAPFVIPEPTSLGLIAIGGITLLRRRLR